MEFLQQWKSTSLDHRKDIVHKLTAKYPDKLSLIVDRATKHDPKIAKNKFLIPRTETASKVMAFVRNNIPTLTSTEALFFFLHDHSIMVPGSMGLSEIKDRYGNEDGFLYLTYTKENTFGCHSHINPL